jgi:hypothetical protein
MEWSFLSFRNTIVYILNPVCLGLPRPFGRYKNEHNDSSQTILLIKSKKFTTRISNKGRIYSNIQTESLIISQWKTSFYCSFGTTYRPEHTHTSIYVNSPGNSRTDYINAVTVTFAMVRFITFLS